MNKPHTIACESYKRCSQCGCNKIVSKTENGKKFTLKNRAERHICAVKVDGCLFKGNQTRCDYLFHVSNNKKPPNFSTNESILYLELKGRDVEHASQQIIATSKQLNHKGSGPNLIGHIVSTRSPRITPKTILLRKEVFESHGIRLNYATRNKTINI